MGYNRFDLWYILPLFRPQSPVLKKAPADGSTQWSMMFSWRRGTTRFSMTWSLLGELNCQISSEFKNLRQNSTRIPSAKLPRTHLLASWHTHSMTGVMTICSRVRIKFLEKIGYLLPEIPFHGQPSWRSESLVGLGSHQRRLQQQKHTGHPFLIECTVPNAMFHRHWTRNLKAIPHGWISGCPSTSLAHRIPINQPPALPTRKTSETRWRWILAFTYTFSITTNRPSTQPGPWSSTYNGSWVFLPHNNTSP